MELLSTHRVHESRLNHIHLSACWTSLAWQNLAERRWLQTNAETLEPLLQHTIRAAMKGQFGARELANVAYGAACIWKSVGVATVGQLEEQLFKTFQESA